MLFLFFCLCHAGIGLLCWLDHKKDERRDRENILPMVFCIPVFGFLSYLIYRYEGKREKIGVKQIQLEKLEVTDQKYRRIEVDDSDNTQIIPLEEALLINNAQVRRTMMLNILHKNPNDYVDMLQRARSSDDAEITHYATTMMMEILTDYENKLQFYEEELLKNPHQQEIERAYINCLQQFINSGLISGNLRQGYRLRLRELLELYLKQVEGQKKYIIWNIENEMFLGDLKKAKKMLDAAAKRYPQDETIYRLYGQYYYEMRDLNGLKDILEHVEKNHIYLSRAGKDWLKFWKVEKNIISVEN